MRWKLEFVILNGYPNEFFGNTVNFGNSNNTYVLKDDLLYLVTECYSKKSSPPDWIVLDSVSK